MKKIDRFVIRFFILGVSAGEEYLVIFNGVKRTGYSQLRPQESTFVPKPIQRIDVKTFVDRNIRPKRFDPIVKTHLLVYFGKLSLQEIGTVEQIPQRNCQGQSAAAVFTVAR